MLAQQDIFFEKLLKSTNIDAKKLSPSVYSASEKSGHQSPDSVVSQSNQSNVSRIGEVVFEVDPLKLEALTQSPSCKEGFLNAADYFFHRIALITNSLISNDESIVSAIGEAFDIAWAQGLILTKLTTRGPLQQMRILIENPHDSSEISQFIPNIDVIMRQTDTTIRFPNIKTRPSEELKYTLSLCGKLENIESAVFSIRQSVPLMMTFDMPVGIEVPSYGSLNIKTIEIDFDVKIMIFTVPQNRPNLVVIKGTENNAYRLMDAVKVCAHVLCGYMMYNVLQNIKLEISKYLFRKAMKECFMDMWELQNDTGTIILVPESDEYGQNVTIIGSVEGIYEARRRIFSQLPITLQFEILDNPLYIPEITSLGVRYGIAVSLHRRLREKTIIVKLKTVERCKPKIFAAYMEIAALQISVTIENTDIPKAHFLADPAFRRALERNIYNVSSRFDEISYSIWQPTDPVAVNNFMVFESPESFSDDSLVSLYESRMSGYCGESPESRSLDDDRYSPESVKLEEPSDSLSPGKDDQEIINESSNVSEHCGETTLSCSSGERCSPEMFKVEKAANSWSVVMDPEYDSDDMEVAEIFKLNSATHILDDFISKD